MRRATLEKHRPPHHPDEAPIVAEVCHRLVTGESVTVVSRWLVERLRRPVTVVETEERTEATIDEVLAELRSLRAQLRDAKEL